ncbi:MAG: cytochrome c oxidase assembly protein [Gammaproteobacteria bacterium]|nr:MAG: cytochrome c oxidase assembly protein [Gammaproteobacteria bacterium]RLA12185.1 MAG: cytochrome c oxidase assembly protein [Gammaproteobacteria bacterium]RLA17154.1 MAG: cytochrome c oxidase assembly protein [Gammaproteobacteria bacterium]
MSARGVKQTALRLLGAAVLMFGFGYALIPLYNVICDVTGINGKSSSLQQAAGADGAEIDQSRLIKVEFIGTPNSELPWEFRPLVKSVEVHPGAVTDIYYHARNLADYSITGQAVPSVVPSPAARHFSKIECFCFTKQTLAAGETKAMLVKFRLDPEIDPAINQVTLSYTFYALDDEGAVKQPNAEPVEMDHSHHAQVPAG